MSCPADTLLLIVAADEPDRHSCQGPALLDADLRQWQERYLRHHPGPRALWTTDGWLRADGAAAHAEPVGHWRDHGATARLIDRLLTWWPVTVIEVHGPNACLQALQSHLSGRHVSLSMPTAGLSIGERIAWFRSVTPR